MTINVMTGDVVTGYCSNWSSDRSYNDWRSGDRVL